jgi:thiol-disulfide isomerase/thioredoxin
MWIRFKRWFGIALGIGFLAFLILAVKYFYDTSYSGDANTYFLKGDYASLDDIFREGPFRDKILYVDLWFSTCGVCRKEFRHLPEVKQYLRDKKQVAFLYISHQTRHPNTRQLWKNAIQELELHGYHFMMDRDFEKRMWQQLRQKDSTIRGGFPHYLIIDNTSGYRNYNAPKPSEMPALKTVIDSLLAP